MINTHKIWKVLLVANVAKEHVNKFHIPTIKYLQSQGWIVDVACSVDAEVPAGDHVYNMSWKRTPFTFDTFKGIKELKRLIVENKYDIIYCHTPVGGLVTRIAARAARKKGAKVIYCAHGLHFFDGAPLINWLIFYPLEKMMAKFTDMLITINTEDYNRVKKNFNQKMKVEIINGIGANFDRLNISNKYEIRSTYRKQLQIPLNATVLIYVAEILKNKNQQMLIHVLKRLRDKGENVYLLLPGPNHQHGEYQKLVNKLGLHCFVKFLGWRSDIGELMASSDICVASSIREGFGINLVEAQYCNLPVVAVSNRGHSAIINDGENGFLVPLNDIDAMTNKITSLIKNQELYNKMASVNVNKYKSDYVCEQIYCYMMSLFNDSTD